MANFKTQIENLTGKKSVTSSTAIASYNSMLDNFLKQSARAVLDVLPDEVLIRDSIKSTITDGTGLDITDKKIVKVLRGDYGAIEIPLELKAQVQASSGSLMEPALRTPVYYIEGQTSSGGKLFIKPNPENTSASTKGYVYYNLFPSPLWSDSSITNFPDLAEYAVVIGASMRVLQHKVNKMIHEEEDIELSSVAQQEMGIIQAMYQDEISRLNGQIGTMAQPAPRGE